MRSSPCGRGHCRSSSGTRRSRGRWRTRISAPRVSSTVSPHTPGISLEELPGAPRAAWTALRDNLQRIIGRDLVAIWAHGGTTAVDEGPHAGDLDTYVILARKPDAATARRIQRAESDIARDRSVDWDNWYILDADAHRPEPPPHAFQQDRRDSSWAIHRAHWLAGRCVVVHGPAPFEVVPAPPWEDVEIALRRELEHLERHVAAGDTDPHEATYAILNGSRILHALDTREVATSKRATATWALEHLPARWHPAVNVAIRTHSGATAPDDGELLASEMAPFVAFVGQRLHVAGRSVSFRRALPAEASAMRDLIVRSMGYWDHPPEYLEEAGRLMSLSGKDLRRDEAWVALVDGAIAGFYRLSRQDERMEIEEFHLDPPMIGQGIGRRMFQHAIGRGRAIGGRWLVWSTDSNALGFYRHMGGEVTGTEPSGIAGDEPLTCMRLDLTS